MALYTKAQLLAEARSLLNETTALYWTDTELNTAIDWAARTMSGIALCTPASEAVSMSGQADKPYTAINAQFIKVEACRYYNGTSTTSLQRLDIRHFGHGADKSGASGDTTRVPQYYYVFGNLLYLWPLQKGAALSTSTATLYGYRVAEDYAHGSTVYDVPDRLQGKLIDFVLAYAYAKAGKYSLTKYHIQSFMQNAIMDRRDVHDKIVITDSYDKFLIPDRTVQQAG